MVFLLIFSIYFFIYSKRRQQKQVEATTFLLPPAMKLGQGYVFTSTISGSCRNTYSWQAGGTNPTAMLSYLLMKIYCCNLILEIYFLKSIFRNVLHLELFVEEYWDNVVKYRHVNKKKKWNECEVGNQFLSSIFSGAWTPSFCEFTWKLSKFQQNKHTPNMIFITYLLYFDY